MSLTAGQSFPIILSDFWGIIARVSVSVPSWQLMVLLCSFSSWLANVKELSAGFSPSCRSRSSARWGDNPSGDVPQARLLEHDQPKVWAGTESFPPSICHRRGNAEGSRTTERLSSSSRPSPIDFEIWCHWAQRSWIVQGLQRWAMASKTVFQRVQGRVGVPGAVRCTQTQQLSLGAPKVLVGCWVFPLSCSFAFFDSVLPRAGCAAREHCRAA